MSDEECDDEPIGDNNTQLNYDCDDLDSVPDLAPDIAKDDGASSDESDIEEIVGGAQAGAIARSPFQDEVAYEETIPFYADDDTDDLFSRRINGSGERGIEGFHLQQLEREIESMIKEVRRRKEAEKEAGGGRRNIEKSAFTKSSKKDDGKGGPKDDGAFRKVSERKAAALPAPSHNVEKIQMPPLIPATPPPLPSCGLWILAKTAEESKKKSLKLRWVSRIHVGERSSEPQLVCTTHSSFPENARLGAGRIGTAWVQVPVAANRENGGTKGRWTIQQVWQIHPGLGGIDTFETDSELDLVGCSGGICYGLQPEGRMVKLVRFDSEHHNGVEMLSGLPADSRIYPHRSAQGVWLVVPKSDRKRSIAPGVWFLQYHDSIKPVSRTLIFPQVPGAAVTSTQGGELLLLVDGAGAGKSTLLQMTCSGVQRRCVELDVSITDIQQVLEWTDVGFLLHCRIKDRWKLYKKQWEKGNKNTMNGEKVVTQNVSSSSLKELCDCPKKAKIISDEMGGLWMWKKAGKLSNRVLSFLDATTGEIMELAERFSGGAVAESRFSGV